jgi:prenyltransferase beta subunit
MNRRTMLKIATAGGVLGAAAFAHAAQKPKGSDSDWTRPILGYLKSLARPDGGFGWEDQPDSHLTPTFAAVGCFHLLKEIPPNKQAIAQFVRTHHPITGEGAEAGKHAADLRTYIFEQVQSLLWLGEDAAAFRPVVEGWTQPSQYPRVYEPDGNPVFHQEMMAFVCREVMGLPLGRGTGVSPVNDHGQDAHATTDISPALIEYLNSRRRPNGSFNNTPASDGTDGNILNTWWGIHALRTLRRTSERKDETVAWLRACQLPCGGFTHQPRAAIGGSDDVAYTWAAVLALKNLGAAPADREACVRYLSSLWNDDGGFGDRPGLPSSAMATYYALEALVALGATPATTRRAAPLVKPLPAGLKPFTIQIEAQGAGSPVEAVELARALRIHLWGAKNARPGWIARAQAIADAQNAPVRFFVANEEYGTFVSVPGLGTYSHTSDPIAPAGADFGPSLAGEKATPWPQFLKKRIGPLEKAGGRMVWQINDNEEWSRVQLDDSVERGSGYAAISTFHFVQNFVYMLPFLFRYRHLIPFVALQDAHGDESWWWADELTAYRTVFLATEPTWEAWLKALREQWVVAIRHDFVTNFRTRMLGGAPGVQDFVRAHEAEWKWWGDQPDDVRRPPVSLVAVTPQDEFEVARPADGVTLRVRLWWQGRVVREKPVVELASLAVDGKTVLPALVTKADAAAPKKAKQAKQGKIVDHYYTYHLPASARGKHTATATVRIIATKQESQKTIEFFVG